MKTPLRLLALVLALLPRAYGDTPTEPFPSGPGVNIIQVTFNQQPVEDGLTFDRSEPHYLPLTIDGQTTDAWASEKGIAPNPGWQKSFRFHVTDPRFQKGGRPLVEFELTACLAKPGSIFVQADTADGNQRIFDQWNGGKGWQTFRFGIDNAFFGDSADRPKDEFPLHGYDFTINSPVGPFYLRSIRVAGYDTQHDVVWTKCLKAQSISTGAPGGLLVWNQAPKQKLNITLKNFAQIPGNFHYRLLVTGYDDKSQLVRDGNFTVTPGEAHPLDWDVDTSTWPLGPYDGDIVIDDPAHNGAVIYEHKFRLGVTNDVALDKARPGEFLYGLDVANTYIYPSHSPVAFAYYRLMGVDIIRNIFDKGMDQTPDNVGIALSQLAPEHMQATLMCDPPRGNDPQKLATETQAKAAYLAEVESRYGGSGPGKVHFYEIGNEPDLSQFYPFPTSQFVSIFDQLRDAIKQGGAKAGLKDTDSVVTTGGLSFAGGEGPVRSEEILRQLDPKHIDAIAYHGHGPGIDAERHAYERVHAVTVKLGIADHPFIETESGYSGHEHRGLEEQCRTAIEKMVYAQSKHEPLLMFFRLFMEGESSGTEGGYGLSDNFIEPHPAIFAYRNMVERLRHQTYEQTLDVAKESGAQGIDAYVFAERSADGSLTGRKTIVVFAEAPSSTEIRFKLDAATASITSPTIYDMYGNPTPAHLLAGNITALNIGENPLFLSWSSTGNPSDVDVIPPMLSLVDKHPLLANAPNIVRILVHNALAAPLETTVSLAANTRVPAETTPSSIDLKLGPGGTSIATFQVSLHHPSAPLRLPYWWKVFTNVDVNQADPTHLTTIPDTLPGTSGPAAGQYVWSPTNHIDIGKLAGGFTERRAAFALAYIDSSEDVSLPCAASADWYMAWYANGTKVYDTLDIGNRGGTLADHTFELPLKKGRNLIVAEVLSGSGGWALTYGGPKERQIATTSGKDPDSLVITAASKASGADPLTVPVTLQDTLPTLSTNASLDDFATWQTEEPFAVPDEAAVKNLWVKEPDSSKWYTGPADLSAHFWLRDLGDKLEFVASVTDDKHVEASSTQDLDKGDAVRVVLAADDGHVLADSTSGLVSGKAATKGNASLPFFATADDASHRILYRWEIPKSLLGGAPFRLSASVLDNDSGYLKQTLDLGDVNTPAAGLRVQTGS